MKTVAFLTIPGLLLSLPLTAQTIAPRGVVIGVVPVPPPPAAPAKDPALRQAIADAGNCFFAKHEAESKARFEAERAVKDLDAVPGSALWLAAQKTVNRYLATRRDRMACIQSLYKFRPSDVRSYDFTAWSRQYVGMLLEYEGQARFQMSIVEALVDPQMRDFEVQRPYRTPDR